MNNEITEFKKSQQKPSNWIVYIIFFYILQIFKVFNQ